jgi:hypothetical protein
VRLSVSYEELSSIELVQHFAKTGNEHHSLKWPTLGISTTMEKCTPFWSTQFPYTVVLLALREIINSTNGGVTIYSLYFFKQAVHDIQTRI